MIDNIITFVNFYRRKISGGDRGLKDGIRGSKAGAEVYDGTPMRAKNILVDGMASNMCPRNLDWFHYILPGKLNFPRWSGMRSWTGKRMDEYPDVKRYLQAKEEVAYSAFNRSNFYDVITELISDAATAGTAHLICEEDIDSGRIVFTVPHFRECFIAEDRFGRVDTNYRVQNLTLRQLADKFGYDKMVKIDPSFKTDYENNFHTEREIIHSVYPRKDYDKQRIDKKNKPIASLWVLKDKTKLIEESGYSWSSHFTWRWRKNNNEWYGYSPSWDSYVDNMTANQQGRSNLIAGQKMAEPPMVGVPDMRGAVNIGPKGWTWVMDMAMMPKPLITGIQLPYSVEAQERTDRAIQENYYVPFFLMLFQAAMNKVELTATQVVEMMGEQASVLGTRTGNFQNEILESTHDAVNNIEEEADRMPEAPQILLDYAGGRIEIDYLSPLAQAQSRLTKLRALRSGGQLIAEAANLSPPILDNFDWDEYAKELADASGFPAKLIRDKDQVDSIREIRAKQQQQQQMMENLPKIAKAAASAGKATEEGSPMQALFGGGKSEGEVGGSA